MRSESLRASPTSAAPAATTIRGGQLQQQLDARCNLLRASAAAAGNKQTS